MNWKIKMKRIDSGKTVIIYTEKETREEAMNFFNENYSRFQDLVKIEIAKTRPEIIEDIISDMAIYRPRKDAEKQYLGFLRGLPKAELEKILEIRLDGTKHNRANGWI